MTKLERLQERIREDIKEELAFFEKTSLARYPTSRYLIDAMSLKGWPESVVKEVIMQDFPDVAICDDRDFTVLLKLPSGIVRHLYSFAGDLLTGKTSGFPY